VTAAEPMRIGPNSCGEEKSDEKDKEGQKDEKSKQETSQSKKTKRKDMRLSNPPKQQHDHNKNKDQPQPILPRTQEENNNNKNSNDTCTQPNSNPNPNPESIPLNKRSSGGMSGVMMAPFLSEDKYVLMPAFMGAPQAGAGVQMVPEDPAKDTANEGMDMVCGM
jgi:hypothetical protein